MAMEPEIDEAACGRLLLDISAFVEKRRVELGVDGGLAANVLASAVASLAVNMHLPKDASRSAFDEAMRELIPRIYDACFSIKDWIERKTPWRMQSQFMRELGDSQVRKLGRKGMDA